MALGFEILSGANVVWERRSYRDFLFKKDQDNTVNKIAEL